LYTRMHDIVIGFCRYYISYAGRCVCCWCIRFLSHRPAFCLHDVG